MLLMLHADLSQQESLDRESQASLSQSQIRVSVPVGDPVPEQNSTARASVSDPVPSPANILRRSTHEHRAPSKFVPD